MAHKVFIDIALQVITAAQLVTGFPDGFVEIGLFNGHRKVKVKLDSLANDGPNYKRLEEVEVVID